MNLKRLNELLKHEFAVLLGGSTFIFSIRLVGAGLTFLTQLLLLKWMGAEELGRFVFAFAIASVLAWISTLGVPVAATRFVPQAIAKGRKGLAAGYFISAAAIVATAAITVTVLASVVIVFTSWDAPGDEFLTLILGVMLVPFLSAMMAQNDTGRSIYLVTTTFLPNMLLRHVMLLAGVATLHFLGVKLNAAWTMGVLLASVATLAIGQFFFIRRAALRVIGKPTPEYNVKEWVAAGLPLVVVFGFTGFFLEINVALAGAFLSRADLAVYNLAFQIANLIAFFLVAVGYQFGPHASRLYGEGKMDALQTLVSRTAHIRIAFATAMFAGLALVGSWILGLFSPAFEAGYTALLILAGTQVVSGIAGPVAVLQNILGLQRSAVIVSVSAIVLDLALTPILATQFGIDGAAMAVLITMTIWNVLMLIAVIRNTAIEPSVFALRNVFGTPHRAGASLEADNSTRDPKTGFEECQDYSPEDNSQKTGTTDH
jgi:O-antigen/teichoic acid export membrane protein